MIPLLSIRKLSTMEQLFVNPTVQRILHEMTGYDIGRLSRRVAGKKLSKIKLMTDEELNEAKLQTERFVKDHILQMPPVLESWTNEEAGKVIEVNEKLDGHSKLPIGFIDISQSIVRDRDRVCVIRQPNGKLEHANHEQRRRWISLFFDKPYRSIVAPELFNDPFLQDAMNESKYEFILNLACHQYEPYDPEFIRVCNRVYFHIDSLFRHDHLKSTRFFGPMCFYLAWYDHTINIVRYFLEEGTNEDLENILILTEMVSSQNNNIEQISMDDRMEKYIVEKIHDEDSRAKFHELYEKRKRTDTVSSTI